MGFWEYLHRHAEGGFWLAFWSLTIIAGLAFFVIVAVFASGPDPDQQNCIAKGDSYVVVRTSDGGSVLGYSCIAP